MLSTLFKKKQFDPADPAPQKRKVSRLALLLIFGAVAAVGSLVVRSSPWARERRLNALSVEDLAYAVHDDPNDALTFLYYGSGLLKAGNMPVSESAFERAIQLNPKMESAYVGLGSARFHQGKMKSANEAFQKAVELNPKDAAAYLGLSQTFYQAGSAHKAIDPLKTLVGLEPKNALAWYHLGRLYGEDHQTDLAYSALQKAVALDGDKADYWRDLAELSKYYGKSQDAEDQLLKALHINHNDPVAHFWLGQVYARREDNPTNFGRAEQEFLAALARDPQMRQGYYELGQLYERHSNFVPAVANFRKACELDKASEGGIQDDKALYHWGYCLVKTGKKAEGEEKMQASQQLAAAKKELTDTQNRSIADPQNRELHLRLARIWRKYDNSSEAVKEYRAYKMLGPAEAGVEKEIEDYLKSVQPRQDEAAAGQAAP